MYTTVNMGTFNKAGCEADTELLLIYDLQSED